jgi:hypothetical protein
MNADSQAVKLPNPDTVMVLIASLEDELKAMRRLLRASRAAAKAAEARQRREAIPALKKGGTHNDQ